MKRIIVLLLVLLMMSLTTSCNKKDASSELRMSGAYYDNITDFKRTGNDTNVNESMENMSGVAKSYLQSVTYVITGLDKENKVATLEVSVPNFTKVLPRIVTDVLAENENASYENLFQLVQSELEKALSAEGIEKTVATVDLPIEENNGEYKLVYNEQWEQIVWGSLEDMYIEYYRVMIGGLIDEIPE